jgi:hypothetical protein
MSSLLQSLEVSPNIKCGYGDVLMNSNWSGIIRIHWWTPYESRPPWIDYWYCHLVRIYLCRFKLFD